MPPDAPRPPPPAGGGGRGVASAGALRGAPARGATVERDAQRLAGHAGAGEAVERLVVERRGDVDEREVAEDVDLADVGAGDPALVRQGAHDPARLHAVRVPDREAVPGAARGPADASLAVEPATGRAGPVVVTGGGASRGRCLGLGPLALVLLLLGAGARPVVADRERRDGCGDVDGVGVVLLEVGADEVGVHLEAAGFAACGDLVEGAPGSVGGDVLGG